MSQETQAQEVTQKQDGRVLVSKVRREFALTELEKRGKMPRNLLQGLICQQFGIGRDTAVKYVKTLTDLGVAREFRDGKAIFLEYVVSPSAEPELVSEQPKEESESVPEQETEEPSANAAE